MTTRPAVRRWLLFGAAASLILAASFQLDAAVQNWMAEHREPWTRSVMRNISYFGDWMWHAAVALVAALIAYVRQNRRWVRVCIAMLLALALAGIATRVVKIAAGRSRPSVELDAGFNGPRFTAKYHAFPSGHTASSIAYFSVIAFVNVRLFAALLPIPLLIGFSRLYVGAHHFSDVIAGALLGATIAVLVARWPRLRLAEREPAVGEH